VIDSDQTTGARHVVDDENGIAGYVFAHVAAHDTGVDIVTAAGGEGDDNTDRFAFEESFLSEDEAPEWRP
jgi:hypothetical protein